MRKRFKLLDKNGRIYLFRWVADGKLFGADWESFAVFESNAENLEMSKTIIKLMNKCDDRK